MEHDCSGKENMDNIVNWGLVASAWAPITVDENGNDVYGVPRKFKGARSITWTADGDMVNVYADGTTIYTGKNNDGYSGTAEFTVLEEEFARYALGELVDDHGLQYEPQEAQVNRFALLWEWEGDVNRARHCMFNVTANRPDLSATTKGDGGSKSAQYQTINLKAIPRANDKNVKTRTRSNTDQAIYDNWFNSVPVISTDSTKAITVTVTAGGNPVSGAVVMLGDGSMAYTNASGVAVLYKEAGTYDLFVSKSGYSAAADSVTVSAEAVSKAVTLTAE